MMLPETMPPKKKPIAQVKGRNSSGFDRTKIRTGREAHPVPTMAATHPVKREHKSIVKSLKRG